MDFCKKKKIPVICFPKGIKENYKEFNNLVKPNGINLDYDVDPNWAEKNLSNVVLQGGLDPKILLSSNQEMLKSAKKYLDKARIFRISFSGELAYEVNVESDNGNFMWEKIMEVGQEFKIQPYGTEALSTLRIEMGHVAGSELDGRTIPYDNSLEGLLSKKKDFIGKRSLTRKAFIAEDRQKVVGVVPLDKKTSIPEGSHLVKDSNAPLPNPKLGYISASCWSVEHDNPFSLAILKDGKNMIGEKLFVMSPLKNKVIPVEIVSSHYVDPKGERVRS